MKALTGRDPWWWAILSDKLPSPKRIENRRMIVRGHVRPPTWHAYRGPILLHASAGTTRGDVNEGMAWMMARGLAKYDDWPGLDNVPQGGIVGRARIVDVIPPARGDFGPCNCARHCEVDGRWHMHEQFGFILEDVEPLTFYPCKGHLGLWNFDESLLKGAA